MAAKIPIWLSKAIDVQFHLLFLLTPLFFYPYNYELFEFNKMILVYLLAVGITGSWVLKMLFLGKIEIPRTPFDIPLLLILISRTLSTIFSIDPHTSLWGYYSRFNEGLFSTLAYLFLFYSFVAYFNKKSKIRSILFSLFISGLLVSLWGIPGHFGADISCLLINHKLGVDCWREEFNPLNRVYSTLGQPNWFAAFTAFIIPLGIGYVILKNSIVKTTVFLVATIITYLAFTFAYSRGGTVGLVIGVITLILNLLRLIQQKKDETAKLIKARFPFLVVLVATFVLISLIFGTAFTARPFSPRQLTSTQLETGGTESGQIRLVVWRGAFDIFKHYPILGSGLETFAYSYYLFRPQEHNLTSEWEFIYNKAHNEYLNTLATTGILGSISLVVFIWVFLYQTYKFLKQSNNASFTILSVALFSGFISILIQNIFGFSVVVLSLLLFLVPAFLVSFFRCLTETNNLSSYSLKVDLKFLPLKVFLLILSAGGMLYLGVFFSKIWLADFKFAAANSYLESEKLDRAVDLYKDALSLRNSEPLYHSQLGVALAAQAKDLEAISEGLTALKKSPYNLSLYKNMYRIYFELADLDKNYYKDAYEIMKKARAIAPTDPKITYNLALSLQKLAPEHEQKEAVLKHFEETLKLKPNWLEAQEALADYYKELDEKEKALEQYQRIIEVYPEAIHIQNKIEALRE